MKILVAGIGNVFHGDDAFGCEVAKELSRVKLPDEVTVIDYGIRSFDLAYALTDGYGAVILVDATSRGEPAGTVFLIEPDLKKLNELGETAVDAHSLDPVSVIKMAQSFGGVSAKLYLVGCEPEILESDEMKLSAKVQAAVPGALAMIGSLVKELLEAKNKPPVKQEAT